MLHLRLDTRAVEALLTVFMLNIGLIYMAPGETFSLPQFQGFDRLMPDWPIGLALIVFGGLRWTAVMFTNGTGNLFYYIRIFGAALSLINWTIAAFITWTATNTLATIFAVASSCIVFELFVILRVWRDMKSGTVLVVVEKDAL